MNATMTQVFSYLKAQGLMPAEEEYGISFKYQMKNFLVFSDDEDEKFFRLMLPAIFDVNDENRGDVLEAANMVNNEMKAIKVTIFSEDSVWVFFEQFFDSTPVFDDIVPRGINILLAAQNSFYENLKKV